VPAAAAAAAAAAASDVHKTCSTSVA